MLRERRQKVKMSGLCLFAQNFSLKLDGVKHKPGLPLGATYCGSDKEWQVPRLPSQCMSLFMAGSARLQTKPYKSAWLGGDDEIQLELPGQTAGQEPSHGHVRILPPQLYVNGYKNSPISRT